MTFNLELKTKIEIVNTSKELERKFSFIASKYGCEMLESVQITSGIDSTVRLIGSHISVMKPYFTSGDIPENGFYMSQPCMRTRNLPTLFDENTEHHWGSYFMSLGLIVGPNRVGILFDVLLDLLRSVGFEECDILIRISSSDTDMINLASNYLNFQMETDSKPAEYYTHKLGINGIKGRNFNIAIRDPKTEIFFDVGNVICIEDNENNKLCYELAIGVSTVLKQKYSLDHVLDIYPFSKLAQLEGVIERSKFYDCLISSRILIGEGLRPFGDDNKARILKTYLQGLLYFYNKYNLTFSQIENLILEFEDFDYKGDKSFAKYICEYLETYQTSLTSKKILSKNESLIQKHSKI